MASLSIRRLDDEVVRLLKVQARQESVSLEELARRILSKASAANSRKPVATAIREVFGGEGVDLEIPSRDPRETLERVDFSTPEYGPDDE